MKRSRTGNKAHSSPSLILEEVLGLTTKNGNGLSSSVSSSKCAYIAGCVVVLYDVVLGTSSHFVLPNRAANPLSCVALSSDARFVAAGESGHQPEVIVWDCPNSAFICSLRGHEYGVACVAFSPDGTHLISLGLPRDGCIFLWDWRNKILLAKVKASSVSSPIISIVFSVDAKFIVSVGKNHLMFWKIRWPPGSRKSSKSVSVMRYKKFDLGNDHEWSFIAVSSPQWTRRNSVHHIHADEQIPFYAVTEKGTLCTLYPGSPLINSVDLEVEKCFALSTSTRWVACACNNGVVKVFATKSLKYVTSLCYAETEVCGDSIDMNSENIENIEISSSHGEVRYLPALPNAIACQFATSDNLVVVYDDHSLYLWNIDDLGKATRSCVLVSHGGCIWDIKNVPCQNMHTSCLTEDCSGGLSFATCSADGTIRSWELRPQSAGSGCNSEATSLVSAGLFELDPVALGVSSPGFRSMAITSDGNHLAAGDLCGNIHFFNLRSFDHTCIQEAHGGEILSLSFNLTDEICTPCTELSECSLFLASGGHDGIIHLFGVYRSSNLLGSVDCSSAVVAVKVARSGHEILSCNAEGFILLHGVALSDMTCTISCIQKIATSRIINGVAVDARTDLVFTVFKDKRINAFDIQSGEPTQSFRDDEDLGEPTKVAIDGSCSYLACSYSSRCICVYDCKTRERVAFASGQSDDITGIVFLPDHRHLASVGVDGCIFLWKLPDLVYSRMLQRAEEEFFNYSRESIVQPMASKSLDHCPHEECLKEALINEDHQIQKEMPSPSVVNSPKSVGFRFSISRLPNWARHKVTASPLPENVCSNSSKVSLQQVHALLKSPSPLKHTPGLVNKFPSRCLLATDSCQVSPCPPETCSWAFNSRWLTIHTVCTDFLDSPEVCNLKGMNVPKPARDDRLQGQVLEETKITKRFKLSSSEPNTNRHFKNGETVNKSLQKCTSTGSQEPLPQVKPSILLHEHENQYDDDNDEARANPRDVEHASTGSSSRIFHLLEDRFELTEIVEQCEEASENFEVAADNLLQLFDKLAILSNEEENFKASQTRLCNKVAEKLPLIERKISAIARLIRPDIEFQSGYSGECDSDMKEHN